MVFSEEKACDFYIIQYIRYYKWVYAQSDKVLDILLGNGTTHFGFCVSWWPFVVEVFVEILACILQQRFFFGLNTKL
jgi:hypothetical protein